VMIILKWLHLFWARVSDIDIDPNVSTKELNSEFR
jgi:hypothetical protein